MSAEAERDSPVVTVHPEADAPARSDGGRDPAPADPPRRPGPSGALRAAAARSHLLLPAGLTAVLALRAGGFFPTAPAVLAVALALLLLARITLADRPFAGWSPAIAVATGALVLFAAWTLVSAAWSDAPLRAMLEFDRALAYVLVFAFMGTFAVRYGDLDRLLRWVALVIGALAVAALVTRLFPAAFPTGEGRLPARLAFPLTYWNALGAFCAIGLVLAVHCASGGRQHPAVRVLAAGVVPVIATTLYFTFSRGGILAAAIGVAAYVVFAHPRRLLVTLAAVVVPAFLAVRAAYGADGLATAAFARFPAEGREVAVSVAACALGAMALRALGLLADRRLDRIRVSPRARRRTLAGAACAGLAALAVVAVAIDAPSRFERQRDAFFDSGGVPFNADQRARLSVVANNGRINHWRVSLDGFERAPLTGTGAGTYRLEWDRERPDEFNVTDAHSVYVEALGELGAPGLAFLLVALLVPLGVAARALLGPERHGHGAFLAAGLALLVHAGLDWDWEMPALFVWFFGASGLVCAARAGRAGTWSPGRLTRVLVGLGCLLLTLGPASVAASQRALDDSVDAFQAGDCARAVDRALDSRDALSVRPEPFELLGYCNVRAGREDLAVRAFEAARARDPHDWQFAYGLAIAQALDGTDPRPMAREARRLNPRDVRTRDLVADLRRADGPERWARAAARARVAFR